MTAILIAKMKDNLEPNEPSLGYCGLSTKFSNYVSGYVLFLFCFYFYALIAVSTSESVFAGMFSTINIHSVKLPFFCCSISLRTGLTESTVLYFSEVNLHEFNSTNIYIVRLVNVNFMAQHKKL